MAVDDYENPADNLEEVDYDVQLPINRDDSKKAVDGLRELQRRARSFGRVVEVDVEVKAGGDTGKNYIDAVKVDLYMLGPWAEPADANSVVKNLTSDKGETTKGIVAFVTDPVMSVEINDWVVLEQNNDGKYYITQNKRPKAMIRIVERAFTDEQVEENGELGNYYKAEEVEYHHTREDDDDPDANDLWRKKEYGAEYDRDFRDYEQEVGHLPYVREANGKRSVRPGTILPIYFEEDKNGRHYFFIYPYEDSFWGRVVSSLVQKDGGEVWKYQIKPQLSDADGQLFDQPGSDIIMAAEVNGVLDIGENTRVRVFAEPDNTEEVESAAGNLYHFEYVPLSGFWGRIEEEESEGIGSYTFKRLTTECNSTDLINLEPEQGGVAQEVNNVQSIKVGTVVWIESAKMTGCGDAEVVTTKYHFHYDSGNQARVIELTSSSPTSATYNWKSFKFNKDTGALEDDTNGTSAIELNTVKGIPTGTTVIGVGLGFDDPDKPIYFEYRKGGFWITLNGEGGSWNDAGDAHGNYKWSGVDNMLTSDGIYSAREGNGQTGIPDGTVVWATDTGQTKGGKAILRFEYSMDLVEIVLDRYEETVGEKYGFRTVGISSGALSKNGKIKDKKVLAENLTGFAYLKNGTGYMARFHGIIGGQPKFTFAGTPHVVEALLKKANGGGNYEADINSEYVPLNGDGTEVNAQEINDRELPVDDGGGSCNCQISVFGFVQTKAEAADSGELRFESTADAPMTVLLEHLGAGSYKVTDLCGTEIASNAQSRLSEACETIGGTTQVVEPAGGEPFYGVWVPALCGESGSLVTAGGEICCCDSSSSGGF